MWLLTVRISCDRARCCIRKFISVVRTSFTRAVIIRFAAHARRWTTEMSFTCTVTVSCIMWTTSFIVSWWSPVVSWKIVLMKKKSYDSEFLIHLNIFFRYFFLRIRYSWQIQLILSNQGSWDQRHLPCKANFVQKA